MHAVSNSIQVEINHVIRSNEIIYRADSAKFDSRVSITDGIAIYTNMVSIIIY